MQASDKSLITFNGRKHTVWLDPGPPPLLSDTSAAEYRAHFALTALWSVVDKREQLEAFDPFGGGMQSLGHAINPATGQPYATNPVLRGDYTFDILAYLALGGAMHDAAIAAWSVKAAYDYVRPVSAIRFMASHGQSSDSTAKNYSTLGLPLMPSLIGVVMPGDRLAKVNPANIGKVALYAWRGPDAITDPQKDTAGVGWILAENWWPYQRPNFVTPAFAGYVSGHSTFSRAAAEVLERLTGDAFFPGGMAEFTAAANEFLVFERGPSNDVVLQWATYRDAADQTSLSRIWGGIHPPADDLPGRRMGAIVGEGTWGRALGLFTGANASSDISTQALATTSVDNTPLAEPALVELELTLDQLTSIQQPTRTGCASTSDSRAGLEASWLLLLMLIVRRSCRFNREYFGAQLTLDHERSAET